MHEDPTPYTITETELDRFVLGEMNPESDEWKTIKAVLENNPKGEESEYIAKKFGDRIRTWAKKWGELEEI